MVDPTRENCALFTLRQQRNRWWLPCVLWIMIIFVAAMPVCADEADEGVVAVTPGTSYSRSSLSGWSGTTKREEVREKMPRPTTQLTIRTYDGFETMRPYRGDEPAYGVDVTAEIETCQNGDKRIGKVNIGGWLYEVEGDCSDTQRHTQALGAAAQDEIAEDNPDEGVLVCDPTTWRCRIMAR